MHRDLALFLKEVWAEVAKAGNVFQQIAQQNRQLAGGRRPKTIDSPDVDDPGSAGRIHAAVYRVYNRFESTHAGIPQSAVPSWLQAINKIGKGSTHRILQIGNKFVDFDEAYARYSAGKADESEASALRGGFIHFRSLASQGVPANYRVYINVMPQAGLTLLRFLIENLTKPEPLPDVPVVVGKPPGKKSPILAATERDDPFAPPSPPSAAALEKAARQFSSCKIAGPLNLGKRSDGILVYCPTDASARGVVKLLEGASRAWFAPEVPRMTNAAGPPGVGISIGAEPPQVNTGIRGTSQQSFGSLRAELITGALMEAEFSDRLTSKPQDFDIFCSRVELAFRGNGLDPNAPAYNLSAD